MTYKVTYAGGYPTSYLYSMCLHANQIPTGNNLILDILKYVSMVDMQIGLRYQECNIIFHIPVPYMSKICPQMNSIWGIHLHYTLHFDMKLWVFGT